MLEAERKTWQLNWVMIPGASATCQVKKGLFKCGDRATAVCVYCARSFCEHHGVIGTDGEEVCDSKNCVAKREDLALHLAYKADVLEQNGQRVCGIQLCESEWAAQCARCKGYFCMGHIETHEMMITEDGMRVQRMVFVCRHCWRRRPIWEKT